MVRTGDVRSRQGGGVNLPERYLGTGKKAFYFYRGNRDSTYLIFDT